MTRSQGGRNQPHRDAATPHIDDPVHRRETIRVCGLRPTRGRAVYAVYNDARFSVHPNLEVAP